MKNLVCVLFAALILTSAVFAASGEIPVTTTSPQARDLFVKARLLSEKFKFADARALYTQALALDSGFALAYRGLAQASPDAKSYQDNMDKAVAHAGKASECERLLILSDNAGGKLDLAAQRNYLAELLGKCGNDQHGHMQLGLYYFGRQYFDSAAAELKTATTLAPGFVAAWNMLGYAHRNLGDYSGAEQAFRKYIELSPEDANAYDSYAELLLKEGKYEDAVTQYKKALAVDSTFVLSYFNMAAPLIYLGRHDEARKACNDLKSRAADDGQRVTAWFGLMVSFADQGNYDGAVSAIEHSNTLSQKAGDRAAMAQNAATIGFLRLEQGQFDEAMRHYQHSVEIARASELAPGIKAVIERNLYYARARIAARSGEPAAALAWADSFAVECRKSGSANDRYAMHELYGIVALDAKDYPRAVEEFKQGPSFNGYDMYRLALAYDGAGDKPKALELMKAAANINSVPTLNDVLKRHEAIAFVSQWSK